MGTDDAHVRPRRPIARREVLALFGGFALGALLVNSMHHGQSYDQLAWQSPSLDRSQRSASPILPPAVVAEAAAAAAGWDDSRPAAFVEPWPAGTEAQPQCPDDSIWAATLKPEQPRIVYSVLTGYRHHRTRVPAVQQTWARHIGEHASLVFYSDLEDLTVPSVQLEPPAKERIYSAGAWRNFPALVHLHDHRARYGCFDWAPPLVLRALHPA
jgi:hypothetical protein